MGTNYVLIDVVTHKQKKDGQFMSGYRIFVVVLCCLACGVPIGCGGKTDTAKQAAPNPADTALPPVSRDSVVIELAGKDSVSVFELLRGSHAVCFQSTIGGVFVKQIDSAKNSASAFWIYSVNDTMPKVAADRMLTRTGDRVKWHLRKM
jgi:hypothetical protein